MSSLQSHCHRILQTLIPLILTVVDLAAPYSKVLRAACDLPTANQAIAELLLVRVHLAHIGGTAIGVLPVVAQNAERATASDRLATFVFVLFEDAEE